ncbi:hypothetical protein ACODT3_42800 [Streptomyces sp. 4.24]|uniref:hypothetical protein n=1 Tax=Streptomyces tritrimontium TaxID=3406573 RepID=UPI003BB64E8F
MTHPVTSTLIYRTVLPIRPNAVGREDPLSIARSVFGAWLKDKYHAQVPLGSGHHSIDSASHLTSHAAYAEDGAEYATRLELRQDTREATWRTTVTAVLPGELPGALRVDLECFPHTTGPLRSGKPRLVQDLVRELEPSDGMSRLTVNGLRVQAEQVARLVDVLCDPERVLPVIVAARPLKSDPLWSDRIAKTMPLAAGDASLYLLWNTEAVDAFREAIGEHHRIGPGGVRTYLTDVDPAWQPDAARHRFLAVARLADPKDTVWRGVARTVQRMALERPQPATLRALAFPDLGERDRQERLRSMEKARAALPAQRTGPDNAALQEEVALLTDLLGVASDQLEEAGRSVQLAERTNTSLTEQLQAAAAHRDAEMEDHLLTLASLGHAEAENARLRALLSRQGRWEELAEATQALAEASAIPASFEEVWERLDVLEYIRVTADRRIALGLDEHAEARTWAAKTWSGLNALNSYAEHRTQGGFSGGFHQFCKSPPAGARVYPATQVAMVESTATMVQYGHERFFPALDGRKVEMQAHLKLAGRGNLAPRVHFLDDLAGQDASGLVLVGYMGPHLTNTRTS